MIAAPTRPPGMATLCLCTALATLSLNMFLPSLAAMATEFDVSYGLMSVAVSGYLMVTGGLTLIIGPLSDRYGRRPVMLCLFAIFVLASLVCATTGSIEVFLTARMCMGVVVGGWTVSLAVVRDRFPAREAASRIGYITMAMAVAPMMGPVIGGAIEAVAGWRATFLTYAGLGCVAFVLVLFTMGETNERRQASFLQQARAYPELLRSRRFWGYALCMAFSTGAFYAFLAGAPLVATAVLKISPEVLGVCIGSITGGFVFGSFLSGRYAGRGQLTDIVILGRLVGAGGLILGLALCAAGWVHPVSVFGAAICVGIGNGLTMPSCNAGALSVRPDLAGSASGLAGALTSGGGALVTAATVALVTPQTGPFALLGAMLVCALIGLGAILVVRRIDLQEAGVKASATAGM